MDEITGEVQSKSPFLRNLEEKESKLQMIEASIKTFRDKTHEVNELEKSIEAAKHELKRYDEKREQLGFLNRQAKTKRVELHGNLSQLELTLKELEAQVLN